MKRLVFLSVLLTFMLLNHAVALAKSHDKRIDELLPKDIVKQHSSEALPTSDLKTEILPQLIKIFLGFVGTISFGVFVYAGVMLIISQGKEEEITKFKNILIWSVVGLTFIITAYALVSGVLKIFGSS